MLGEKDSPSSNENQMRLVTTVTKTRETVQNYGKLRTNGTGLSCLLYAEKARNLALFVMSPAWSQDLLGK